MTDSKVVSVPWWRSITISVVLSSSSEQPPPTGVVSACVANAISTNDDGYFEADVEPGSYTVRIRAYGFKSQNRDLAVENHGVTVLNVELKAK